MAIPLPPCIEGVQKPKNQWCGFQALASEWPGWLDGKRRTKPNFYRAEPWARIFKRLRCPRIDSKASILPAYVAWRAGTITLFVAPARLQRLAESIPWNRFLGPLNVYKYGLCSSVAVQKSFCQTQGYGKYVFMLYSIHFFTCDFRSYAGLKFAHEDKRRPRESIGLAHPIMYLFAIIGVRRMELILLVVFQTYPAETFSWIYSMYNYLSLSLLVER